ncbi:NB-ARC domain-containing protein, partial [Prochlorothrix hollandica]|uniref:NB-ARC domain-containing protein n=1 Tax=Prochlorothrix hollandica TaxID=1223 RepID=UPI0033425719
MAKQRDRGRVLTATALETLHQAWEAWGDEHDRRLTQERLRELTIPFKAPNGLDLTTISKIHKGKQGVDTASIEIVFQVLGLPFEEADLQPVASPTAAIEIHRDPKTDWGEKPDTAIFFGRTEELGTLQQWILTDQCRVVTLLGMGGMGKTSLAAKLADQIQTGFDYVIWRSLREAPPLDEILVRIIQFCSDQQETETNLPKRLGERINRLLHYLRESRCLLILDNVESILEAEPAGQ